MYKSLVAGFAFVLSNILVLAFCLPTCLQVKQTRHQQHDTEHDVNVYQQVNKDKHTHASKFLRVIRAGGHKGSNDIGVQRD